LVYIELGGMWNEMVVAYFEVSCRHLFAGIEEREEYPLSEQSVYRPKFEPSTSRSETRLPKSNYTIF
jgi:hypothetical protein